MPKGRVEAFSDGVIAILITIMVLELRTPVGTSWHALQHELPVLLAYALSFVYLGIPTAVYGIVLLCAAIAYLILQTMLLRAEGEHSVLRTAIGQDLKGRISPLLYCLGIGLSFVDRWLALAVYVGVALMWLVPDRRLERHVSTVPQSHVNKEGS